MERKSGYAGRILRVNLSSESITHGLTKDYASEFLGGRGLAAKLFWDAVPPEAGALDAENMIIYATGPLAGLRLISGSRWVVCAKSPVTTPEHFNYCNLGGKWGAEMKFAGYDAIAVQGMAEKPVYLLIQDDNVQLKDASFLWGRGTVETREILKSELGRTARVVAIGPAGENRVTMASLLADNDSSGSAGMGAVMGSKRLKAIVVKSSQQSVDVARPDRLRELVNYYRGLRKLPFRVESPYRYSKDMVPSLSHRMQRDPCYGCPGCSRKTYEPNEGKKGKFVCHSAMFYQPKALKYYGEWNDVPAFATRLVDSYGIDSKALDLMMNWLERCYEAGIINDDHLGISFSEMGSLAYIETLLKKISFREGFGDILAGGLSKAADYLGPEARAIMQESGYLSKPKFKTFYGPRLYITTSLFYAMEPRTPIQQLHEISFLNAKWASWAQGDEGALCSSAVIRAIAKRFWGSETAADFSTYEGKALAAKMIQDRQTAKESLILCDVLWPIMDLESTEDHVGDPTLESKILSAVTGEEVDEAGLNRIGERIFNLQRAIMVREGHRGRDFDDLPDYYFTVPLEFDFINPECLVPGKGGKKISRKGEVVDRKAFERMKDEYYHLRHWDVATGLQTRAQLEDLGLNEVAQDLEQRGLAASDN